MGERLMGRIRREFRLNSLTVTTITQCTSLLHEKAPKKQNVHQVSEMAAYVENIPASYNPKSVLDYYWGLRTLAYAWAKCGNYQVDSMLYPPAKVMMMPLDTALNYAGLCLRVVSTAWIEPQEQLGWLCRNDQIT